jgi:hypothetical protein
MHLHVIEPGEARQQARRSSAEVWCASFKLPEVNATIGSKLNNLHFGLCIPLEDSIVANLENFFKTLGIDLRSQTRRARMTGRSKFWRMIGSS